MTGHRAPKVLLTTLTERTSAKGNVYLAGWLGKARVVGFRGEEDEHGQPTWNLYLQEPEPRPQEDTQARVQPRENVALPATPPLPSYNPRVGLADMAVPTHEPLRTPERLEWATRPPAATRGQRHADREHKAALEAQRRQDEARRTLNDPIPD